jgi:rfaE bifunctional protein nucleotidyltransferase chain/domain
VPFRDKILGWDALRAWRDRVRQDGERLVVTNGCFDLLHIGHATYLEAARSLGDRLLVGLNSDASVRVLKGPSRPIHHEDDRAGLIAALGSVDAVCLFQEPSAERFLDWVRPDIWAKGGDYTLETVHPAERALVERCGGTVVVVSWVPGRSTTSLLARTRQLTITPSPNAPFAQD